MSQAYDWISKSVSSDPNINNVPEGKNRTSKGKKKEAIESAQNPWKWQGSQNPDYVG